MGQKKHFFFGSLFFGRSAFGGAVGLKNWEKLRKKFIRKKMIRKKINNDTEASLGRTNAKKVQICFQTQTASCRLETGMDDYVAAVTAAVAVY